MNTSIKKKDLTPVHTEIKEVCKKTYSEDKTFVVLPSGISYYIYLYLKDLISLQETCRAAYNTISPSLKTNSFYKLVMAVNSRMRWDKRKISILQKLAGLVSLMPLIGGGLMIGIIPGMFSTWEDHASLWNNLVVDEYRNQTCASTFILGNINVPQSINQCGQLNRRMSVSSYECENILNTLSSQCVKYGFNIGGIIIMGIIGILVLCLYKRCSNFIELRLLSNINDLPVALTSDLKKNGIDTSGKLTSLKARYPGFLNASAFTSDNKYNVKIHLFNQAFFRRSINQGETIIEIRDSKELKSNKGKKVKSIPLNDARSLTVPLLSQNSSLTLQ